MEKPLSLHPRLDDFRLYVLPTRFEAGFPQTALYNQAFNFWHEFWNKVMKDLGSHSDPYEFHRSDFVNLIMYREDVVAMLLSTVFNLQQDSVFSHPYFRSPAEQKLLQQLRDHGCKSAISMEYLTVNENYRKGRMGFSFTPVLVQFAYRLQTEMGLDAAVGRARQDVKSNLFLIQTGATVLQKDVQMHNVLTDFCATFKGQTRPEPDLRVRQFSEALWNRRYDLGSAKAAPLKVA